MKGASATRTFAYVISGTDGTLADPLGLIVASYNHAVAEPLKKFDAAEVSALFGPTIQKILAKTVPPEHLRSALERYHAHYQQHFHEFARVYLGVHELLSSLHQEERKLAVCTGAGEQAAKVTLEQTCLPGLSVVVSGDDVSQNQIPKVWILAMRAMGASAEQAIYIGDTRGDIEASRKAGIQSAVALWGSGDSSRLRALRPDFIFRGPSEVLEVLLND